MPYGYFKMKFGIGLRDKQKLNLGGKLKNKQGYGVLPMSKAGWNTCQVTVGDYGSFSAACLCYGLANLAKKFYWDALVFFLEVADLPTYLQLLMHHLSAVSFTWNFFAMVPILLLPQIGFLHVVCICHCQVQCCQTFAPVFHQLWVWGDLQHDSFIPVQLGWLQWCFQLNLYLLEESDLVCWLQWCFQYG